MKFPAEATLTISVQPFLHDLLQSFRVADVVDIVLIALILYAVLVWFRETTSRRVLVGVLIIVGVYFTARNFELYLTSQLLHAGFTVVVIALVVIFQEDLRRGFERIATLGTLTTSNADTIFRHEFDMLVEAVFDLASKKHGVLIAITGKDDVGRHVHGGVPLSGKISRPLLDSLFDPSSAGHDGAVLVESGIISRFSVHLPISKNRAEVRNLGTRHAAGLGLAELTDALTIIVSEERGAVSLAEGGKLTVVSSPAELKRRLDEFSNENFPVSKGALCKSFVLKNWPTKAIATLMAVLAWLLLAYSPNTVQRTFVVPIEYRNVPKALEVDDSAPVEARVTLSGTDPAFRLLDPARLKIWIDLSNTSEGTHVIEIQQRQNLIVPANLTVYRIQNRSLVLVLNKRGSP